MNVGYARVSTSSQSLKNQIKQLKAAGCKKTFYEKRSGKNESDWFSRQVYFSVFHKEYLMRYTPNFKSFWNKLTISKNCPKSKRLRKRLF